MHARLCTLVPSKFDSLPADFNKRLWMDRRRRGRIVPLAPMHDDVVDQDGGAVQHDLERVQPSHQPARRDRLQMRGRIAGREDVDPGKVAPVKLDDVAGASRKRIGQQQIAVVDRQAGNSKILDRALPPDEGEPTVGSSSGRLPRYSLIGNTRKSLRITATGSPPWGSSSPAKPASPLRPGVTGMAIGSFRDVVAAGSAD